DIRVRKEEGNSRSVGGRGRRRRGPLRQKVFQEVDRLDKVTSGDQHHEVDGVEVLLTAEATAQIRLGIDRGLRLTATRADEREPSFTSLAGPVQVLGDDTLQGNLVSKTKQQLAREVLGHVVVLFGHDYQSRDWRQGS